MAIISLFSGSYCHSEDLCDALSERLGWTCRDEELMAGAAERAGVKPGRLADLMMGTPPFFNRLTRERETALAALRAALADLVREDDFLLHGFAGLLLPRSLTHVLQVCAIANTDHRIATAQAAEGLDAAAARKSIEASDGARRRWTRWILDREPYAESVYDVVLAMQDTTVDAAADLIVETLEAPGLRTTDAARRAVEDFRLAARVQTVLVGKGHDVEVTARDGAVEIGITKPVLRMGRLKDKLETLAAGVEGVTRAEARPGARYVPAGLMPDIDVEPTFRTLLVDDEKEFVQTLSERLSTRNLLSDVVYDGEQALAALDEAPPEVMVLDLKMPGIDGIEVLERVKRDHPAVEVIILTGHGSDVERERAEDLGAFAYLQKPVDIDVLARTMKAAYAAIDGAGRGGAPVQEDD